MGEREREREKASDSSRLPCVWVAAVEGRVLFVYGKFRRDTYGGKETPLPPTEGALGHTLFLQTKLTNVRQGTH